MPSNLKDDAKRNFVPFKNLCSLPDIFKSNVSPSLDTDTNKCLSVRRSGGLSMTISLLILINPGLYI